MAFTLILSIHDRYNIRGFLPVGTRESAVRQRASLCTRVFIDGMYSPLDIEMLIRQQENIQREIHEVKDSQPHFNAWYLTDATECKKTLNGILRVLYGNRIFIEMGTFSKTFLYLRGHGYLNNEESEHFHRLFKIPESPVHLVSIGLTTDPIIGAAAIFFSIHFLKRDENEEMRYVSITSNLINCLLKSSATDKNLAPYMSVTQNKALTAIENVRPFLLALLKAEWKEWRPFSHYETCLIDKDSFRQTLASLGEKRLLSPEEVDAFSRQFFNG